MSLRTRGDFWHSWPACLAWAGLLGAVGSLTLAGSTAAQPSARVRLAAAEEPSFHVTEVEYRLRLSSAVIKAGPVSLEAIDSGLDPHDLRLRAAGSTQQIDSPLLTPGHRWADVVNLRPGVYSLWCSLPEHARLGMHATLRVVR
jgi:hypothetical protein